MNKFILRKINERKYIWNYSKLIENISIDILLIFMVCWQYFYIYLGNKKSQII